MRRKYSNLSRSEALHSLNTRPIQYGRHLCECALNELPKPPYPKAPITEAVIHLRVAGNASADDQKIVVRRLSKDYPHSNPLQAFNVTIDTTGGSAAVEQKPQGFRLSSADQADLVLVFPNGIAIARVAPYPGWEHLRERAQAAWAEWRRSVAYSPLTRLGIRYLNRIDIRLGGEPVLDLDLYLNFRPHIPKIGKGPISGYMLQATLPTANDLWSASITSTIVSPPPLINHVSLLLDIDIFRTQAIPGNEAELWRAVEEARALKNSVFESCISDKSRELFA